MPRDSLLFNDDVVKELFQYLKVGNYLGTACAACGIGESTYYRWMKDGLETEERVSGRQDEEDLRERMEEGELVLGLTPYQVRAWLFRNEVNKAIAIGEAYAVAMVRSQMPQQWTAAMTFLERRFPKRWKRREQIDFGAEDEVASGIDETILLQDPQAVKLLHEALQLAARNQLPAPDVVDATVVDDEKGPADSSAGP